MDAVREWTEQHVRRVIAIQKERDRVFDEKRKQINVAITATAPDGTELSGVVVYHEPQEGLIVRLDAPVEGMTTFDYGSGYGAAMKGTKVWEVRGESFTDGALDYAKQKLLEIFTRFQNKDLHDMVEELNQGRPEIKFRPRGGPRSRSGD